MYTFNIISLIKEFGTAVFHNLVVLTPKVHPSPPPPFSFTLKVKTDQVKGAISVFQLLMSELNTKRTIT